MADFVQKYDLDLRFGGSTLGDFGQFYDVELPYIYKCLNAIRRNQVSPAGESVEPAPNMFKVEDDKVYIRDADNQNWIFLMDAAYRGGLFSSGESLLKNTDLATPQSMANKVAVYDSNGALPANITGSASQLVGKAIDITGIEDGQTLAYNATTERWEPSDRYSSVGEGKSLTLRGLNGTIGSYNGGTTTSLDIPVNTLLPNTSYAYGAIARSNQLASNVALVCVLAGSTASTIPTLGDQDVYTIGSAVFQKIIITPMNLLLRNQTVVTGEIRFTDKIASNLYLECTTGGTTSYTFPSFTGLTAGATVTDGTVVWTVRRLSGMAGTIAVSDNTGANTGAQTSINANGATTIPLPANIVANVTGNVTGNCSGSSGSCVGNSATASKISGHTIVTVTSFSGGVLTLATLS